MSADARTVPLPDGSTALIEPTGPHTSLISRVVDGECVWGQVFSRTDDHPGQVAAVIDRMAADPAAFTRWWAA